MQVDTGYYSASAVKSTSIRLPTQCVYVKYTGKILMLGKGAAMPLSTQTTPNQYSLETYAASPYVYDPEILGP